MMRTLGYLYQIFQELELFLLTFLGLLDSTVDLDSLCYDDAWQKLEALKYIFVLLFSRCS